MNSRDINLWKKILSRIAENRLKIFDKYTVRYCNTNKNNKGKKNLSGYGEFDPNTNNFSFLP